MKYKIYFTLVIFIFFNWDNLFAQEKKPYWIGIHASRSYATSGDYYGLMTGLQLEKDTKKKGIIGFTFDFNMHSEVANPLLYPNTSSPSGFVDLSYWRVMSGVQLGAYVGKNFIIAGKHSISTNVGPILRLQFNSNDGYGVFYPPAINLPFPVYIFENTEGGVKRKTFGVGVKGMIQYKYELSEKWQIGLHASSQIDSQGDNFYNYGFLLTTRFLR